MSHFKITTLSLLLLLFLILSFDPHTPTENSGLSDNPEEIETPIKDTIPSLLPTSVENTSEQKVTEASVESFFQSRVEKTTEMLSGTTSTTPPPANESLPTLEETPSISFSEINTLRRPALINIFCTTDSGGFFRPISGSGVLIHEKGVILTNAHVAQYFLLRNASSNQVTCTGRVGNPAKATYLLEPLYISPAWIEENAESIVSENPLGTGEYDYALLAITGTLQNATDLTLPLHVPLSNQKYTPPGTAVYIGGYPAGFIGGITIQKGLTITSTVGTIDEVFTFKEDTPDLITVKGSILSQQGASGGAVIASDGTLIGIVVTSTSADNTEERVLGAITTDYIKRDFKRQTEIDLLDFLERDISTSVNNFKENDSPILRDLLLEHLQQG